MVTQSNWNSTVDVAVVIGEVVAAPVTDVLEELRAVKSAWSGLEMTQDCMPVVSQERSEVPFAGTVFGLATKMMLVRETWTEHWAPVVFPPSVQASVYVAVLVPAGGVLTVVVAEPPGCVVTLKELLLATPEEQPYVMASVMPTSATFGSQESSALGPCVEIHCQPVTHAPV